MSKRKKKKQREYSPPPLSKLDVFIYNTIIIIISTLIILSFVGIYCLTQMIGYADKIIMLSYGRWTITFIVPAILITFIPLINFFAVGLEEKKPIFGNKNVNYFSTTRYAKAEFLFKKKSNSKDKKNKIILAIILAIVVVICTVFALVGRYSIDKNGEIKVYSVFNTVKNEYSIDKISNVTIEIGRNYSRYGGYTPNCFVNIKTESGKLFYFNLNEANWFEYKIPEKIANISTLKTVFDNNDIPVTVIGEKYIDEFIEYYELTNNERKLLQDLFYEV